MKSESDILKYGRELLEHVSKSLYYTQKMLDGSFIEAVRLISEAKSKIILVGMGKSGVITKKLSLTMVSIGFLSYYLHPAEALHGDLGIIRDNDIIIALSNSGETQEVLKLIRAIRKLGTNNKIISITSKGDSSLANRSDIALITHVESETKDSSDELARVVPAASAVVTLALGDALSFTATKVRGFKSSTLAMSHPGGSIGKFYDL